jgi:uncharacterized protein YkwD
MTAGLRRSAESHDGLMASGCGLLHQCPGEHPLASRETTAGVHLTITAGENINEGAAASNSSNSITQEAVKLTQDMLNDQSLNESNRKNIFNSAFHHVGIAICEDSYGKVWVTIDFAN